MLHELLSAFGLEEDCQVQPFGSGLINSTWKIGCAGKAYILQRINEQVFPKPELIMENMHLMGSWFAEHTPDYPFIQPLRAKNGKSLVSFRERGCFRLTPFVHGSHSVDVADTPGMAYEAARQFGKFTRLLSGMPIGQLRSPLPDFHDLNRRQSRFESAVAGGDPARISEARDFIRTIRRFAGIPERFEMIKGRSAWITRATHHDTKISNVLFDEQDKGLCVIDLDTVMPGLFISDLGDMMRTGLSPVGEEEKDFDRIAVREDFFEAIVNGWLEEMGDELMPEEREHILYAGKFMCYMQAIRFLTDHLLCDPYYGAKYPGHNLMRAGNQLVLLQRLTEKEAVLRTMIPAGRKNK